MLERMQNGVYRITPKGASEIGVELARMSIDLNFNATTSEIEQEEQF